jgi:hypothetical protein
MFVLQHGVLYEKDLLTTAIVETDLEKLKEYCGRT